MTSYHWYWAHREIWFFGVLLAAYLFGRGSLRKLEFASASERTAFSIGIGLGAFGTGIFFLGVLGWLTREMTVALAGSFAAWGAIGEWRPILESLRRIRERSWQSPARIAGALAATIAAYVVLRPMVKFALYPPHIWDALSYHLPAAKMYGSWNAVLPTPSLRFPVFSQLNEMLFAAMMLLSDDIGAQLIECSMMLLTALALFAWGRRLSGWPVGLWAAALWLASPEVLKLGGSGLIDVGLTLFVTLGVFAFENWRAAPGRSPHWLAVAGLCIGFGMATKYTAIFIGGALGIVLLVDAWRNRSVKAPLTFSLAAAAASVPWFFRNWYYTRDPLFPYFGKLLGFTYWSALDMQRVREEMSSHGMGRSLGSLLALPWNLAFHQKAFIGEWEVSPLLFLMLPVLFWFLRSRGVGRELLLLSLSYILFWFWQAQVLRYLLPVLPLLCLLTALLLKSVLAGLEKRLHTRLFAGIALAIAVVFVWPGYSFSRSTSTEMGTPPMTAAQRDAFLERFAGYRALQFLNRTCGDRYCVYAFDGGYMHYFADGLRIGDVVGDFRYSIFDHKMALGRTLFRALRATGADHLLTVPGYSAPLPSDRYFRNHFQLVYSDKTSKVFRLHTTPLTDDDSGLVTNGGFEEMSDGKVLDWATFHPLEVRIDSSGEQSRSGRNAAEISGNGTLKQEARVRESLAYDLVFSSRSPIPNNGTYVQLNWYDASEKCVLADARRFETGVPWRTIRAAYRPPKSSVRVSVIIRSTGPEPIFIDDVSLVASQSTETPPDVHPH